MSENYEIEMEFQRLKTRVKDVGGIGMLSNEEDKRIEQFCREQNPQCPRCGERNTKFRYIENKKSARTLQPRYKCNNCKVGEDSKKREFTWGGKQHREKVTEQSNIRQEPQVYQGTHPHQRPDMPSDGGSWQQNTAGVGVTTGVPPHEPEHDFFSELFGNVQSTDRLAPFVWGEVDTAFQLPHQSDPLYQGNYTSNATVQNELGDSFRGPQIDDYLFENWSNTIEFK